MRSSTTRGSRTRWGVALAVLLLAPACAAPDADGPNDSRTVPGETATAAAPQSAATEELRTQTARLAAVSDEAVILDGETPDQLAAAASSTFFTSSPAVVLVTTADVGEGEPIAVEHGIPLLVAGPSAGAEINRLGARVAFVLGEAEPPAVEHVVADGDSLPEDLPDIAPAEAEQSVALLTTGSADEAAAAASARAAGAHVIEVPGGDPRATSDAVRALAEAKPEAVVAVGETFGDAETLAWRTRTAATGVELPGGGQLALPGKTYVALYGTPSTGSLGVLGEQPIEQTIERAREHAGWYEPLTDETVVPTLEIIATVASVSPGRNNAYSNELPVADLRPLIDLAGENGLYVVIDLQPGRNDFLSQAQRYEELLRLPHVGLALDPEWRLGPNQRHLVQIGRVSAEEINSVVTWLADLTREHNLPQKVLVLHQFQTRMIPEAEAVDQSRSELAILIHADGQGSQPAKQSTWQALHANAPSMRYWGWKNFYDEDVPMLTPEETMAGVDPLPDFISYQ